MSFCSKYAHFQHKNAISTPNMVIFLFKTAFRLKNGFFSTRTLIKTGIFCTYGLNLKKLSVIFIPLSNQSKIKILIKAFLILLTFFWFSLNSRFLQIMRVVSLTLFQRFFNLLKLSLLLLSKNLFIRIFKFSLVFSVKRQLSIEIV